MFNKKAQLGMIEFKFAMIGVIMGIIITIVVIYLANNGTLPFNMNIVCPKLPVK